MAEFEEIVELNGIPLQYPAGSPAAVLVADDDPGIRRLYRKRLEASEYDFIEAADGRAALAAARACRVDAIMLDVMMPEVDGWGALGVLRDDAHTSEAKIILMSADPGILA